MLAVVLVSSSSVFISQSIQAEPSIPINVQAPDIQLNNTYFSRTQPSLYALLTAEFAYNRGQVSKALAIYKQEAFTNNAYTVFERAFNLSLKHEDIETSLDFASAWQKQHSDYMPAWFYVAHLALQAQNYQLARDSLNHILKSDPKADFNKIFQDIYPENDSEQRQLLITLQQLHNKDNPTLSIMEAGLLLKFGDTKTALTHVNRALKVEPNNISYILLKANILQKLNQPKQLFKLLSKARKKQPAEKRLYLYEIRYRLRLQQLLNAKSAQNTTNNDKAEKSNPAEKAQLKKAWQLALKTIKRFPDDPEIQLLTALISIQVEEYSLAGELLTTLLDRPAYMNRAYYHLGDIAEKQQDYQKAKYYFSQVKQLDLALNASKKVVGYELQAHNPDKAIEVLVQLRNEFEIYAPESYILQATILEQQGKLNQAKNLLMEAIQSYDNPAIQFHYAKLLDNRTNYQEKLNLLSKLKKHQPNNLDYQLHYAQLLLSKSRNNPHSKQIFEDIIHIPKSDPNFDQQRYLASLNALATMALASKHYQQVINYLEPAYQQQPTLTSGVLLLEGYRGTNQQHQLTALQAELKQRFHYLEKEDNNTKGNIKTEDKP